MTDRAAEADGPDPICADDRYPRYEPGIYEVLCYAVKIYFDPRFKRWVCWLQCQFLGEKEKASAFLNMGMGSAPAANRGSEYWRVWVMAKGEQPRRGRLSKKEFVGKIFRVRIGDTVMRYDKRQHSEAAIYSTIKEFLERTGP